MILFSIPRLSGLVDDMVTLLHSHSLSVDI